MKDKKDMYMNCFIHKLKSDAGYLVVKIKCRHTLFVKQDTMSSTCNPKVYTLSNRKQL